MPQNDLILLKIETSSFHLKGSYFFKLNHCETFHISYKSAKLSLLKCPIYGNS